MGQNLSEKPVSKSIVHHGKFLEFHSDQVQLPNGKIASREYLRHPGAVAAVPILPDGRIVLVKQFRYPTNQILLEIPAGKLDSGESPDDCVRRELAEEIGYEPQTVIPLTSIWTTPAFTDEVIHLYLARDLKEVSLQPDEDEFLETVIMSRTELWEALNTQTIIDAKTAVAVSLIEKRNLW